MCCFIHLVQRGVGVLGPGVFVYNSQVREGYLPCEFLREALAVTLM